MSSPTVTATSCLAQRERAPGALPAEPNVDPTDSSEQVAKILGHSSGMGCQLGHCGPRRRFQTGSRLQLACAQRERIAGSSAPRIGTLDGSPATLVPGPTGQVDVVEKLLLTPEEALEAHQVTSTSQRARTFEMVVP